MFSIICTFIFLCFIRSVEVLCASLKFWALLKGACALQEYISLLGIWECRDPFLYLHNQHIC
jgi:hypothetical protein